MTNPTTPCVVCATKARDRGAEFFATRGLDWPVTEVAGHTVHKACTSEAEHAVRDVADGSLIIGPDGIGRWASNGSAIPHDCALLFDALGIAPALNLAMTTATRDAEVKAVIKRYRDNQPAEASAEELAELRAAFGPGQEIVDVISGRVTRT